MSTLTTAGREGTLLRALVHHATLAPSSHNTQPWRFRVDGGAVELRADRSRSLPVVDPHDRALVISCGAALAFLRVAMRHAGRVPRVERAPDPADPDLLACVEPGEEAAATAEDAALFAAIPGRHTNRRPFEPRLPPGELLDALADLAAAEGAWLRLLTDPSEKEAVAELVAEGDRRQAADPAFRRELAEWIHPNWARAHDGMPGAAHGVGDVASLLGAWAIRTFDWGDGQAARDRQLALGSPVLAVLGTAADDAAAWLRAGEALGLVLLRATAAGLSASFLNQPVEVPELRPRLARLLGVEGAPQLVLRLGYGPPAAPTPRRPVDEVLLP